MNLGKHVRAASQINVYMQSRIYYEMMIFYFMNILIGLCNAYKIILAGRFNFQRRYARAARRFVSPLNE